MPFHTLMVSHPESRIMMILTICFSSSKDLIFSFSLLTTVFFTGRGSYTLDSCLGALLKWKFLSTELSSDWERFFYDRHLSFKVKLFISWENTPLSQTYFFWTPGLPPGYLVLPPFPFEGLVQQMPVELWLVFLLDCLLALMSCYRRSSTEKEGW